MIAQPAWCWATGYIEEKWALMTMSDFAEEASSEFELVGNGGASM